MTTYYLKQGDTRPAVEEPLTNYGITIGDLTGAVIRFRMRLVDGLVLKVNAIATIVDTLTARVRHTWLAAHTNVPGHYLMEWLVTYADGSTRTLPSDGSHEIHIGKRLV